VVTPRVTSMDDKIAHFAVFALIATLVCRAGPGWRAAAWAVGSVSLFGALDEWHQSFVPGRMPSVTDWVADTLGALVACGLYVGWPWYRRLLEFKVWPWRRRAERQH
jgi:VanZ family protein